MKKILKAFLPFCSIVAVIFLFCSCDSKERVHSFDYVAVQMSEGDNWSIVDKNGKEVVWAEYPADAEISSVYHGVYWVKQNGKYQLFSVNQPKTPLIDEEFTGVTSFWEAGVAAVSAPNKPIRIIDTEGKVVKTLPKDVKRCWRFSAFASGEYAVFMTSDNKCGVIDRRGSITVGAVYDNMNNVSDGMVIGRKTGDSIAYIVNATDGTLSGKVDTDKQMLMTSLVREGKLMVKDFDNEDAPTTVLDKTGKRLFNVKKSKEHFFSEGYADGYKVFRNDDSDKFGVIDDKGEVLIRPKYDFIINLGRGEFAAKKGEKFGVVDEKDETVLDFDYDMIEATMGDNYLVKDGSGYAIVNRDGKELNSFDKIGAMTNDSYAEYIDLDGLVGQMVAQLEDWEIPRTAKQYATEKTALDSVLSPEDLAYNFLNERKFPHQKDILDGKVQCDWAIVYERSVMEERTHIEKVSDGWFTYDNKVSDGYFWTDALPENVSGKFTVSDMDTSALFDLFKERISKGRTKVSDVTFTKTVKVGKKALECRTTLSRFDDEIGIEINFIN